MKLNGNRIRREIRLTMKRLKKEGHKTPLEEARRLANIKYGKGWRDKVAIQEYMSDPVSNWEKSWQEKNLDGSFAYNGVTDDF